MSEIQPLIDEAVSAMTQMTEVLDRETLAIRQTEWSDLAPLQAEKARLARLCERRQRDLNRRAQEVRGLPEELRQPLELAGETLSRALQTNLRALELAREASSRIVTLIIETAKQAVHPGVSYDQKGGRREASSNRSISLRLNERL